MARSDIEHCVAVILELARRPEPDRRALLQLGYNLGRFSELTGLGREPFWDRWKQAVAEWDLDRLDCLATGLEQEAATWLASEPGSHGGA